MGSFAPESQKAGTRLEQSLRSGQLQLSNSTLNPQIHNAIDYVAKMKSLYLHEDKMEEYDAFCRILLDFSSGRFDIQGLIARMKELFRGRHSLILDFGTFLPKGYGFDLNEISTRTSLKLKESLTFLNKVKNQSQHDEKMYTSFLEILTTGYGGKQSIYKIYQRVEYLFQGHHDLLDEFKCMLFGSSATTPAQHAPYLRNPSPIISHCDEKRTAMPMIAKEQGKKRKVLFTSNISHVHKKACVEAGKEKGKRVEKEREKADGDMRDHNLHNKDVYTREIIPFKKIKEKLHNVGAYRKILQCLDSYNNEIITRFEFQDLVAPILGKYPDLIGGLNQFLANRESLDWLHSVMLNEESLWNDGYLAQLVKIEDVKGRKHGTEKYARDCESNKGKERECIDKNVPKGFAGQIISVSEPDLSNFPSHHVLPKNYQTPQESCRTEFVVAIVSDNPVSVSVTSGSEYSSSKLMSENPYEEALFRCENDRFEADMLLQSVNSTATHVEELLEKIHENVSKPEIKIRIEDHLTAMNLRCIERLYGDYGLDMIDILHKNSSRALPTIRTRLKQKKDELLRWQSQYKQIWADVYSKNFHKSLDHRSFCSRQSGKKSLSTKGSEGIKG